MLVGYVSDEYYAALPDVLLEFRGADEARLVTARCGDVRVGSVYVPNGRLVGSEHFAHKLEWLAQLGAWLDPESSELELAAQPDVELVVPGFEHRVRRDETHNGDAGG